MQHLPRTQLYRCLRGVYYETDSIITNWQRGLFTITQIAGNVVSSVPDLFWPEQYRFTTGAYRAVFLSYLAIVFSAFILRAVVNQMWKEDALRIGAHSKSLPWPNVKYESLAFLSSASTSICKSFMFAFFWPELIPIHCEKKRP